MAMQAKTAYNRGEVGKAKALLTEIEQLAAHGWNEITDEQDRVIDMEDILRTPANQNPKG
jgi:hypothetical protein